MPRRPRGQYLKVIGLLQDIIIKPLRMHARMQRQDVVRTEHARNVEVSEVLDAMDDWDEARPVFTLMAFIDE